MKREETRGTQKKGSWSRLLQNLRWLSRQNVALQIDVAMGMASTAMDFDQRSRVKKLEKSVGGLSTLFLDSGMQASDIRTLRQQLRQVQQ